MKKIVSRVFIILALVLTTINVCFPSDLECSENEYSSSCTSFSKDSNTEVPQEKHHCVCSLACNSWMTTFSTKEESSSFVIISTIYYSYKISYYPKVSLSMDKPPTV